MFALHLALLAAPALAAPRGGSLAGLWVLTTGRQADGARYSGTLEVLPQGAAFHVTWHTSTAGEAGPLLTVEGVGRELGGRRFVVAWGGAGLVTYTRRGDGSLDGSWTPLEEGGAGVPGLERASGHDGGGVEGAWRVEGTTPEHAPYAGLLQLSESGGVVEARWVLDGGASVGVGVQRGPYLALAYGPEGSRPGLSVFTVRRRSLAGPWVLLGASGPGRERARRPR